MPASTRGGTPAVTPNALFCNKVTFTAISLSASPKRAASSRAITNSGSTPPERVPGRDDANASRAPRLATSRARMIVERSTPQWSAHCTTVISPVSTCTNASYFCTGDNRRLPRRPPRSKGLKVSVI